MHACSYVNKRNVEVQYKNAPSMSIPGKSLSIVLQVAIYFQLL